MEFVTVEEIEETIRGDLVQTPAMVKGGALHDVVAFPDRYHDPRAGIFVHRDRRNKPTGWRFGYQSINDLRHAIGAHVVELKTEFEVAGHTIVAKADGLTGREVHELKVRGKVPFEPDWFVDSFQWRIYALAFKAGAVTYHLVTVDDDGPDGVAVVETHQKLTNYPYPSMAAEVRALVLDFADFARSRNLEGYLGEEEE